MRTMLYQIENISKEMEIIKGDQVEIQELKSIITEMKNSLEGLNRRSELEERISKFENRSFEIIQSEKQKDKRMKKNEQSLRDCGTHMVKHTNLWIMGVTEGEEREKE